MTEELRSERGITVRLSPTDDEAIRILRVRYGQKTDEAVLRLCLHMVANATQIILGPSAEEGGRDGES